MEQVPAVSETIAGPEVVSMARTNAPRYFSRKRLTLPVTEGDFLDQLKAEPRDGLLGRISKLTAQEAVILDLIMRGYCNKEISKLLTIEVATAKAHTSRIFKKLCVKNRVQAAVLGLWSSL